jgi:hypothetical protein
MFPTSSIASLNRHTCESPGKVLWYMVVDRYKFHVYVVAAVEKRNLYVRIDWNDNSTLRFDPYVNNNQEQHVYIGSRESFCRECIIEKMKSRMGVYKLFRFNCRTMSYIILTDVTGFDRDSVFQHFNSLDILCGLDIAECVSLEEIHHYTEWANGNSRWCNII